MKMSTDREWLKRRAEQEDKHFIAVGGFVGRVEEANSRLESPELTRTAFIRFLQFARRERQLSVHQFAAKANVDLAELLEIENNPNYVPTPRAIYRIAEFLKVPAKRLMALAGLIQLKDTEFDAAALRFAANSESVEKLSKEEHEALREYVKFLCE